MALTPEERNTIETMRARAQEMEASEKLEQEMADAERIAAYLDGNLSIDELDPEVLKRHIQLVGPEGVTQRMEELFSPPSSLAANKPMSPQTTWWGKHKSWLAVAASVVLVTVAVYLQEKQSAILKPMDQRVEEQIAKDQEPISPEKFALQWEMSVFGKQTEKPPARPPHLQLPVGIPNDKMSRGTMGSSGPNKYTPMQLATVIVHTEQGWGSGVFISPEGYLLTNYHVIDSVAQQAAITGQVAQVEVITAEFIKGRMKAQPAVKAQLFRVDPKHDLALLKVMTSPGQSRVWPYLPLADQEIMVGEHCIVIGSQSNGPAWGVRLCTVDKTFKFPQDLSQVGAEKGNPASPFERRRATMIQTRNQTFNGDPGGPLLNTKGELVGITQSILPNQSEETVSWHIALPHIKEFLTDLPRQPEGVPFDPWTAGIPMAHLLEPELVDGDRDGQEDTLRYRFALPAEDQAKVTEVRPVAYILFVDFNQQSISQPTTSAHIPKGLWGMETMGDFPFDLFLLIRADGISAVGYTDDREVVREIRMGHSEHDAAATIWQRETSGRWQPHIPTEATSLIDSTTISQANLKRLQAVAGKILHPILRKKTHAPGKVPPTINPQK